MRPSMHTLPLISGLQHSRPKWTVFAWTNRTYSSWRFLQTPQVCIYPYNCYHWLLSTIWTHFEKFRNNFKFVKFWNIEPSELSSSSLPRTSLLFLDLVPPCLIQLPFTCSYQGSSVCQLVMWHICFELFRRLRTLTNVSSDVQRYCPPPMPPSPGLCLATQPGLR